jgi:multiple sugar transport system substrate-binding protein
MLTAPTPSRFSRRHALLLLGGGAGLSLLAACGQPSQPASPAATSGAAPAAPTQAPPAGGQPAATQAPAQGAQAVNLRWFFWTGSEEEVKFWTDLAAQASQALGNINITFETDTFANFWVKLPTQVASGTVADLVGLQSLRCPTFTSRGVYQPLDDLVAGDKDVNLPDFSKVIVDGLSYQGKLYALAYDFGPIVTYFNKNLFQKAGVPAPKNDWSTDDFLSTAHALTREIDGQQVFGYAAPNSWDSIVSFIYSNGADFADADFKKSTLSSADTAASIQFYADLINKEKVAAPITDPSNANWNREQFYAGRVAMYHDGPWNFVNARSKMRDDWDIASFPRGKAGSVPWVAGSGFGISALTKNKNEAWQALKWLTSTDSLNQVAKAGRGYPGRQSSQPAFVHKDVPPEHQELIAEQVKTAKPYRVNTNWQEIVTQLGRDLVDPITLTGASVPDAIKNAEPAYQDLIDKGAQA